MDPEYRAKDTAATLKKYHSDPEFREQRLAQMASDRRRAKAKGTTVEHIQQLRKEQGGCCAICGVKLAKRVDYRHRECLDHDHKTGVVRGILCHYCNVAIGYLEDDPERVRAAADYLERAAARTPSHTF